MYSQNNRYLMKERKTKKIHTAHKHTHTHTIWPCRTTSALKSRQFRDKSLFAVFYAWDFCRIWTCLLNTNNRVCLRNTTRVTYLGRTPPVIILLACYDIYFSGPYSSNYSNTATRYRATEYGSKLREGAHGLAEEGRVSPSRSVRRSDAPSSRPIRIAIAPAPTDSKNKEFFFVFSFTFFQKTEQSGARARD